MKNKKLGFLLMFIITGIFGFGLAWYWYGWRLSLIFILVAWNVNLYSKSINSEDET